MGNHILKITSIGHVTHDVLKIITTKPKGVIFKPGQAGNIAINKSGSLKPTPTMNALQTSCYT